MCTCTYLTTYLPTKILLNQKHFSKCIDNHYINHDDIETNKSEITCVLKSTTESAPWRHCKIMFLVRLLSSSNRVLSRPFDRQNVATIILRLTRPWHSIKRDSTFSIFIICYLQLLRGYHNTQRRIILTISQRNE